MELSVVILNYNVSHFLQLCLQSVVSATRNINAEIIVVDNASEDDSVATVKQLFPDVTVIANTTNTGFPKGNNIGVAKAKGEYICILNPDTVVGEDTFQELLEFARSQPNLGIAGAKLIDGSGNFLPESKRGVPTPWVAFTKFFKLYKISPKLFGEYYTMQLDKNTVGRTSILVGAFMFMKRTIYQEVNGFDEGCFMYSDDIDLSYTIEKKGYVNYYAPVTTVIHYKGESTKKDALFLNRFREAMNFFYKKHFKVHKLFDVLMRVGIKIFSSLKLNEMKQHQKMKVMPKHYIYAGANEKLFTTLKNKYPNIQQFSLEEVLHKDIAVQTEIIFDADCNSYKDIINSFKILRNKKLTFKIHPKNSNFIIGSNRSDVQGEVITL